MRAVVFRGRVYIWIGTVQDVLTVVLLLDTSGTMLMEWHVTLYHSASTGATSGNFLIPDGVAVIDRIDVNECPVAVRLGDKYVVNGELTADSGILPYTQPVRCASSFSASVSAIRTDRRLVS